jgi:hypothetical protein
MIAVFVCQCSGGNVFRRWSVLLSGSLAIMVMPAAAPAAAAPTWGHSQDLALPLNSSCSVATAAHTTDRSGHYAAVYLESTVAACPRQVLLMGVAGGSLRSEVTPFKNYPSRQNVLSMTQDSTGVWFLVAVPVTVGGQPQIAIRLYRRGVSSGYALIKTLTLAHPREATGVGGFEGSVIATGGHWWAVVAKRVSTGTNVVLQARTLGAGSDGRTVTTTVAGRANYTSPMNPKLVRSAAGSIFLGLNVARSLDQEAAVSRWSGSGWGALTVPHAPSSSDHFQFLAGLTMAGSVLVSRVESASGQHTYSGFASWDGARWHYQQVSTDNGGQLDATTTGNPLVTNDSSVVSQVLERVNGAWTSIGSTRSPDFALSHADAGGVAIYVSATKGPHITVQWQ